MNKLEKLQKERRAAERQAERSTGLQPVTIEAAAGAELAPTQPEIGFVSQSGRDIRGCNRPPHRSQRGRTTHVCRDCQLKQPGKMPQSKSGNRTTDLDQERKPR
jgi:hypothetical protein